MPSGKTSRDLRLKMRKALFIIALLNLYALVADARSVTNDSVIADSVVAKQNLLKKLDKKLTTGYFKSKYDSGYVVRPAEKWLLKLSDNLSGTSIHAKGTVNDVWSKYDLYSTLNNNISLEVDYCDIAVAASINPSKIRGTYDDYELNFEYHGNQISLDLNYQRSTSLEGDIDLGPVKRLEKDALYMKTFTLTGYYIFNHRHFSFPAAFYQNYIQLRSAGSWLAGLTFQSGCIRTTDELIERSPSAPDVHIDAAHVGIGGGYGYNFVFGKHSQWLFHLSMLPTVVVYNHNELTVRSAADRAAGKEAETHGAKHMRFNMVFNERAALVYHFSEKCFAGATLMMSNSIFDDKAVVINQNKGIARAFVGIRL